MISTTVKFYMPFKDYHLVSKDYIIDNSVLETWTLGRLKVPNFKNENEMREWILAVDSVVTFHNRVLIGPSFPYQPGVNDAFKTNGLSIEDINGDIYEIPSIDYNKHIGFTPDGDDLKIVEKLLNYLNEDKPAYLNQKEYDNYSYVNEVDGKYYFDKLYVCKFIYFLTMNNDFDFSPPENQKQLDLVKENYNDDESYDRTNIFWRFKNKVNSNNVVVFSVELDKDSSKREEQLSDLDGIHMWQEKLIYKNTIYLTVFETDKTQNNHLFYYYSNLKDFIKEYDVECKCRSMRIEDFIDVKTILRKNKN